MAIIRSIYSGISGLRTHQAFMDVVGNNISNVNTIGFKAGRITFEETFSLTLRSAQSPTERMGGVNPIQLGLGTAIGSIDTLFSQGTLETTDQVTDLAIQGDGFFILSDGVTQYYTRSGALQFDAGGSLVNPNNGLRVQGVLASAKGVLPVGNPIQDIILPFGKKAPAKSTTEVSFTGNLNAGEKAKGTNLETKPVYAVERPGRVDPGSNSNVQGLIARSSAGVVTRIEGVTENATTVTVSDGLDRTGDGVITDADGFVFTFVGVNTASDVDFHSLQDLVDGINNVFVAGGVANPTGAGAYAVNPTGLQTISAQIQTDGSIRFTRYNTNLATEGSGLMITSTNSNLQRALESANDTTLAPTSPSATDQFSHIAAEDDLLTYFRDSNGVSLGLQTSDQILIDGYVGGIAISNTYQTFDITDGTENYSQFKERIRKAFDITSEQGEVTISPEGYLLLKGDGGTANEVSSVNIRCTNRPYFNAIFDSTPNNWIETQKAKDVLGAASSTVYDSLGQKHVLTLTFTKDSKTVNKWFFELSVNEPAEISGGQTGYISFNADGSLSTFIHDGAATTVSFSPKTGAIDPVSITIEPGTVGQFDGITQLGAFTSLVASDQNGYGLGKLDSISIDNEGKITGTYTNGVSQFMGQLSIAVFNNPGGLSRGSDNTFYESANSGTPIVGYAGTSIPSIINPGALEQSNVELAQEFANMIVAQRGFQANARVVTVSDQFLTEIVNLKT